ncbi:MAG: radical SAM protein [Candidatus Cloacimonetes bacterium]|nr:radical SAM protein [Candidatus Cloacimonadota bacterium]
MQKIKTNIIYPIFIPHQGCPYRCIYCDQNKITKVLNKSDENKEFIPDLLQIQNFINKHKNKYKEIAFYGGTFTRLTIEEINSYLSKITPFMDEKTFFRISTRPDLINDKILQYLKSWRINTIELGIQTFSDNGLKSINRGYTSEIAEKSCNMVLLNGFNLSIQLLIGLPEENSLSIKENIDKLIEIKPDFVRLYPLLVLKDTELENMYIKKEYTPLDIDEAIKICSIYLKSCEDNGIKIIKIGLHSDISRDVVIAGPFHERFGEIVKAVVVKHPV